MKVWLIVLLCVAAGGLLVWWGIKSKSLPKILGGIAVILGGLLGGSLKRNSDQRAELKRKDAEIAERKKTTEVIKDVQEQIKEIDKDTERKPEDKAPPAAGDSAGRLDRLRQL